MNDDFAGNPNQQDALHGYSAVHYAASQGHTDCLKELLKAGGQTDLLTKDGQTCLDIATGDCCDTLLHYQRGKSLLSSLYIS